LEEMGISGSLGCRGRTQNKEGVWQRRRDEEHKHVFSQVEGVTDGIGEQVCHECGFTIEVEEL